VRLYWESEEKGKYSDIIKDGEGIQTMKTLGENMARLLKRLNL
jgi:hypothetical protein